jgi:phosphoglycerate dehydrogenase-like enzyme
MNSVPDLRRRDLLKVAGAAAALSALPFTKRVVAAEKMKIGMIGSGNVGSALGRVWAKAGHEVMFSSRNLDRQAVGRRDRPERSRRYAARGRRVW